MPNINIYLSDEDLNYLDSVCKENKCGRSSALQAFLRGQVSQTEELKDSTEEAEDKDPEIKIEDPEIPTDKEGNIIFERE